MVAGKQGMVVGEQGMVVRKQGMVDKKQEMVAGEQGMVVGEQGMVAGSLQDSVLMGTMRKIPALTRGAGEKPLATCAVSTGRSQERGEGRSQP